jgi:hypothetical protein
MDDRLSKPKRKPVKSAHPSQEGKEAMTATLEKARLKDERLTVQPVPLEPPSFKPPAGDSGTAAPPLNDFASEAAAAHIDDYDYGGSYGGYQATHLNTTLMDNRECDARAEYNFHTSRRVSSTPGFSASYSAPFIDPDAYGHGHHASSTAPPRESARPDAANFGGHRTCHERLLPCHPVVCWSG